VIINQLCQDFFSLFFPEHCAACGTLLVGTERVLCTRCLYELPLTGWESFPDNPMAQMMWGRVPLVRATAFFFFHKESRYQQMMHRFKYRGQYTIGLRMGRLFGASLRTGSFPMPDAIIPVPLHHRKLRERGYNQSMWIARGIGRAMDRPVIGNALVRQEFQSSQTRRLREDRWENISGAFRVCDPENLKGKHLLLVDDVITTGATLEACATELLRIPGTSVSLAALAAAER